MGLETVLGATVTILLSILVGFVLGEVRHRRAKTKWLEKMVSLEERSRKVDTRSQTTYRSKYVAQAWERLGVYFPGFPIAPRELVFCGAPVDFIGFEGLSDESPTPKKITIHLVEMKFGGATLGRDQERIREAVLSKRIVWTEWRAPKDDIESV